MVRYSSFDCFLTSLLSFSLRLLLASRLRLFLLRDESLFNRLVPQFVSELDLSVPFFISDHIIRSGDTLIDSE